jgi:hypothetical protein
MLTWCSRPHVFASATCSFPRHNLPSPPPNNMRPVVIEVEELYMRAEDTV